LTIDAKLLPLQGTPGTPLAAAIPAATSPLHAPRSGNSKMGQPHRSSSATGCVVAVLAVLVQKN